MSEQPDPDAELLGDLGALLGRVDPVPPEVTEFANAALDWRRVDSELAELLADSALETQAQALSRSTDAGVRWLTFRTSALAIDVEVDRAGEARILRGQLAPPVAATVEAQAGDGSVVARTDVDGLGRFRLELAAGGRVRLRVRPLDPVAAPIETSWLTLS